jgi:polysaccharide biosynthesis/export protein
MGQVASRDTDADEASVLATYELDVPSSVTTVYLAFQWRRQFGVFCERSASQLTRIGRVMKLFRATLSLILLFPTITACPAQGVKPVLTADPTPQAAAADAVAPSTGQMAVDKNYLIGPADSLQVTVWNNANLSGPLLVRPDGKISLSLLGDITAAGFTPMQLAADIATRLKKFVTDPVVDVTVLAVNSKHVFLMGEVARVGPLAVSPGMTILQAIATAGGLTPYANKKHIYILRGDPGKQQKIFFDYTKALKKGDMQGVELQPGDTIVVP